MNLDILVEQGELKVAELKDIERNIGRIEANPNLMLADLYLESIMDSVQGINSWIESLSSNLESDYVLSRNIGYLKKLDIVLDTMQQFYSRYNGKNVLGNINKSKRIISDKKESYQKEQEEFYKGQL